MDFAAHGMVIRPPGKVQFAELPLRLSEKNHPSVTSILGYLSLRSRFFKVRTTLFKVRIILLEDHF
jgi:hypothetical protein